MQASVVDDNGIKYIARADGTSGNGITVDVVSGSADEVVVVGNAITVTLNDAEVSATSTITQGADEITLTAEAIAEEGNGIIVKLVKRESLASLPLSSTASAQSEEITVYLEIDGSTDVLANFTTALTGTNNDLVFTSKLGGPIGNTIQVSYSDPVEETAETVAQIVGNRVIRVYLAATGAPGSFVITATAADVKAAIEANFETNNLITVANAAANDGTGVVTTTSFTLANGTFASAVSTVEEVIDEINNNADNTFIVASLSDGDGTEVVTASKTVTTSGGITRTPTKGQLGGLINQDPSASALVYADVYPSVSGGRVVYTGFPVTLSGGAIVPVTPGETPFTIVSVLDHGATGNGVTDDTIAVQSAVDEAASSGATRTVYFPPGEYKCNITVPVNVQLEGAGVALDGNDPPDFRVTTLRPASDSLPVIEITELKGQSIQYMDIFGNGDATSVAGVKVGDGVSYPGMGLSMRRIRITGFTDGIYLGLPNSCSFEDVSVNHCGRSWRGVGLSDTWHLRNCCGCFNSIASIEVESPRGVIISGGEWGHQAAPLLLANGGGHVTWQDTNIESVEGDYLFRVGNTSLTLQGNRIGVHEGTATAAIVRRTFHQGRDVLVNNIVDSFAHYAETGQPLIWETEDTTADWPVVDGMEGALRVCTSSAYTSDLRVDTAERRRSEPNRTVTRADDFMGGSTTTGHIGDTGWGFYNWAGSGAITVVGGDNSGHPGNIAITTGATIGDAIQVNYGAGVADVAQDPLSGTFAPFDMVFVLYLPQITNMILHVGWVGGTVTGGVPDNFVGVKFNSAGSANFVAYTRDTGTSGTETSTGVVAGTTAYHTVRIRQLGGGSARVSVDGGQDILIETGIPAQFMNPAVLLSTSASAAKSVNFDFWRWRFKSNRFLD